MVQPALLAFAHMEGNWGECCPDDARVNDDAVANGGRVMSVFNVPAWIPDSEDHETIRIWVITEARGDDGQRAVTTVLLPEEY